MTRKYVVVGLVALMLALLVPGGLAQSEGVIEVQVVNSTAAAGPVGQLAVTLRAFQSMAQELDEQTAVTDAEGRVSFDGVDVSPDITYLLTSNYAGVDYSSQPLSFEETGDRTLIGALEVYEATENPDEAAIQVERMHVFLDFQDGVMSVGELHIFANASDRTFIGVQDPELGQRVTLRFALPEGATELRFQMGGEGDRYVTVEDGFADTEAVRPGTSQQVLYGYSLSYGERNSFDFVRPLLYPTANLNVLVPRAGVDAVSDQVELSEIRTVEGQAYLNLNGKDFAAGGELSVHLSGLQDIVGQAEPVNAAQEGFDPKWIALGLAALALAGGLIYPSLRRVDRPMPDIQPVEAVDTRLDRLLQAIADLDNAFEAGEVDEERYHKQRQALKHESIVLMRES